MTDTNTQNPDIPALKIVAGRESADKATIMGLILAMIFIGLALYLGGNLLAFVNIPSVLIVVGGTIAVTMTSFSIADIKRVPRIVGRAMFKREMDAKTQIKQLLDIATLSKKYGVLALQKIENDLRKDAFLHKAMMYVSDGFAPADIHRVLNNEIDSVKARHQQSAEILYRAAEVAPAMGLIGTLVGLVQMLAMLDDPSIIGPSMAVALLTTLYGAFLGTVILSPLAAKLERNSSREELEKTLIILAALSMAKQENPRRLEVQLNSEVPPQDQLRYFDGPQNKKK